jgi:hypothetical protein
MAQKDRFSAPGIEGVPCEGEIRPATCITKGKKTHRQTRVLSFPTKRDDLPRQAQDTYTFINRSNVSFETFRSVSHLSCEKQHF